MTDRVEWEETRDGELFFIIADRTHGGWVFNERSTWESRWYPARASVELLQRADKAATALSRTS
jgi:hypothetical protein